MTELTNSILEIEDIAKIKPNFDEIKILKRDVCEQTQTIIFEKEWNTLKLISTNNFPEELKKITKMLEEKWLNTQVSYTSSAGFQEALKRYDQYDKNTQQEKDQSDKQKQASWKWAISMLKEVFEKRNSMEPGDFIMEIVRLAFQTWASDLHFQKLL